MTSTTTALAAAGLLCALAATPASALATLWLSHGGSGGPVGGTLGTAEFPAHLYTPKAAVNRATGLAFDPLARVLWSYEGGSGGTPGILRSHHAGTGATLSLVPEAPFATDGSGHDPLTDLAVDPTTGLLWGIGRGGTWLSGAPRLYLVDPLTAARSVVGAAGFGLVGPSAIAFSGDGRLFAAQLHDDPFVLELDPDGGAELDFRYASLGVPTEGIFGLGWDPDAGVLVASVNDASASAQSADRLFRLDFVGAGIAASQVADFNDGRVIHDLAYVTAAVPLPAGGALLAPALGALGLARRRGRAAAAA